MKKLIMLNGTMGAGKSTLSKVLNQYLEHSVWLDGDWCWMADPFVVNEQTKAMVIDNITYLLRNFLKQKEFEHIIFCWVMDEEEIVTSILDRLQDLKFDPVLITLHLQKETLLQHLQQDIEQGLRSADCIEKSLARQQKYEQMNSIKLAIDGKTLIELVKEITEILGG